MRLIRAGEHVAVPWKNGGGTATNIVAAPEGAGFDAFDWRLSGAQVARTGPFSIFPFIDRTMLILSPGRLELDGFGGSVTLTKASPPFDFPGDIAVSARAPDGPIDNLNLMFDRRRFRSATRRLAVREATPIEPRGVLLVYCEAGMLEAGGLRLAANDTLVAGGPVALTGAGEAIVMEIWPL